MEREKVKRILLFCRDIDGEIAYYSQILRSYENQYYTLSGATLTESFINSRNKISRPTETTALNIPESVCEIMRGYTEDIQQLGKLKAAILKELDGLPLHQRKILYYFYIEGLQWVQISVRVNYSPTQCKEIRNRGLDILGKNFRKNRLIKNFNYPS